MLKDPFNLPPKRLLVTTFLPSAWADDALIQERKEGLAEYLTDLLLSSEFKYHSALHEFLLGEEVGSGSNNANSDGGPDRDNFDLEDALPSTLPRRAALTMAAMGRPTGADVASLLAASSNGSADAKAGVAPGSMHYAAYYPGWSAYSNPPERLDFSKFDILYFGSYISSDCKSKAKTLLS